VELRHQCLDQEFGRTSSFRQPGLAPDATIAAVGVFAI
jgi:hypothetical protein